MVQPFFSGISNILC